MTTWSAYEFRVLCDRIDQAASKGDEIVFAVDGHDDPDCVSIDADRILTGEMSLDEFLGGQPFPVQVVEADGTRVVKRGVFKEPWPCPCVPADALERILAAAQSVPASVSGDAPGRGASEDVTPTAYPERVSWAASAAQLSLLDRLVPEAMAVNGAATDAMLEALRVEGWPQRTPTWQTTRQVTDHLLALRRQKDDKPNPMVNPGRYAVEVGGRLRFFRWDAPTSGRNKGRIRLTEEIGSRKRVVYGEVADEVLAIIAEMGEDVAGMRYAEERTRCFRCGIVLTDPESRRRGLGPDCAKKWGRP